MLAAFSLSEVLLVRFICGFAVMETEFYDFKLLS